MELETHEKTSSGMQIVSQRKEKKKERFLDFLRAAPSKEFWRFGLGSPDAFLKRVATLRASSVSHAAGLLRRAPAFARTVDWRALRGRCVCWAKQPTNAALLVWLAFVSGGVSFVFLLMTGALNSAVPDASRRKRWTEVANQVLNALFTVMCVYQHPRLCHHLALLLRWRAPNDVAELRAVYCKNVNAGDAGGGGLRNERVHVALVVALLHATCLAQYAYCALFWFFDSNARPDWAVNLCMAFGLAAPVAAALYMVYGPLGKRKAAVVVLLPAASTSSEDDDDDDCKSRNRNNRVAVAAPEWAGGLFDLGDDPTVAALSASCTFFCVFGWNMERLGFGNMYVHVFTFALVFAVAALNVHDATLAYLVGATGALLSVLGLLYGGYWRAQMRKRFGLPAHRGSAVICGGRPRPSAADYGKWLLCAPCALAQEVRTANLYDVEDGRLYYLRNGDQVSPEEETPPAMAPLQREGCVAPLTSCDAAECVIAVVDAPPIPVMPPLQLQREPSHQLVH